MCCVACMIVASVVPVQCAIGLLLMSELEYARKYKDVCVLTRCDLSNMDCICVVLHV